MKSLQLVKKLEKNMTNHTKSNVLKFIAFEVLNDLEELKVKIKQDDEKFKELLRENTALKITIDRLTIQEIDNNKIYHIEDKLNNRKLKHINDECMFDNRRDK